VKEPAKAPSSSKDINEEGKSAEFVKMSPEIIRPLPKDGPTKTEGRKHGKSRIPTDTPEKNEIEKYRAKMCKKIFRENT
jgi:hypothetical protein